MTIKQPDREIKRGKLTVYEDRPDIVLDDLICSFCGRSMNYGNTNKQLGQGTYIKGHEFRCDSCCLLFHGVEDFYEFKDLTDFYNYVKSLLGRIK